jgi:hypothetical protein
MVLSDPLFARWTCTSRPEAAYDTNTADVEVEGDAPMLVLPGPGTDAELREPEKEPISESTASRVLTVPVEALPPAPTTRVQPRFPARSPRARPVLAWGRVSGPSPSAAERAPDSKQGAKPTSKSGSKSAESRSMAPARDPDGDASREKARAAEELDSALP